MWVYQLILCAVIGIFLEKEKAPLRQEDSTLLFASNLKTKEVVRFSFAQYLRHNKYPYKKQKKRRKFDSNSSVNQRKCGT